MAGLAHHQSSKDDWLEYIFGETGFGDIVESKERTRDS
jgi:hypothetical protein